MASGLVVSRVDSVGIERNAIIVHVKIYWLVLEVRKNCLYGVVGLGAVVVDGRNR